MSGSKRPSFKASASGLAAAGITLIPATAIQAADSSRVMPPGEVHGSASPSSALDSDYRYGSKTIQLRQKREIGESENSWTSEDEDAFDALCRMLVFDTISDDDKVRYEMLKLRRRQVKAGRTYEEIRRDVVLHEAMEKAIDALELIRTYDLR